MLSWQDVLFILGVIGGLAFGLLYVLVDCSSSFALALVRGRVPAVARDGP